MIRKPTTWYSYKVKEFFFFLSPGDNRKGKEKGSRCYLPVENNVLFFRSFPVSIFILLKLLIVMPQVLRPSVPGLAFSLHLFGMAFHPAVLFLCSIPPSSLFQFFPFLLLFLFILSFCSASHAIAFVLSSSLCVLPHFNYSIFLFLCDLFVLHFCRYVFFFFCFCFLGLTLHHVLVFLFPFLPLFLSIVLSFTSLSLRSILFFFSSVSVIHFCRSVLSFASLALLSTLPRFSCAPSILCLCRAPHHITREG